MSPSAVSPTPSPDSAASTDPVELLWDSLINAYGSRFLLQYAGIENLEPVKADWGSRMSGVRVGAVRWALDNLPERPPNAIEFRNLCRQYNPPNIAALPAPVKPRPIESLPEAVRAAMARIHEPLPDTGEPQQVVEARRYVARFGGRTGLTHSQSQNLGWYRGIIQRHEDSQATLARVKARMAEVKAEAEPAGDVGSSGLPLQPAAYYGHGRQACADGKAKGENPHPRGSKQRTHWDLGWQAEFDAMPAELRAAALARWVPATSNAAG